MNITLLESPAWKDYELLDSGNGLKLERFGSYRFVRPEVQALWKPALPASAWRDVHGVFQPTSEESGGHWDLQKKVAEKWKMSYALTTSTGSVQRPGPSPARGRGGIEFWAMTTPGRHLGVFPEVAAHWDWFAGLIAGAGRPARVLNLFGYTGLATLAAAKAGATVTHVDASKKSVTWARDNQTLSGLDDKPIRWIVDDALKFVQREGRRGAKYDGIILDPPKFGRGPKGEVWEVYESLPELLAACRAVLSDQPLFLALTMYAIRASAVHLHQSLEELLRPFNGQTDAGELVTRETSRGRLLSLAVYARWEAKN
jgi:23S rRNA (cytosine1962-C5)-methyltransferase